MSQESVILTGSTEQDSIQELLREDDRSAHQRAIDAITQFNIENYDSRAYDMVLREVPYCHTPYNSPDEEENWYHHKGDIDLGLVNVDDEILRVFEVKSSERYRSDGRDQLEKLADSVDSIRDRTDFGWDVTGNVILAENIADDYLLPESYSGDFYCPPEVLQKFFRSEGFSKLSEHLFYDQLQFEEDNNIF